MALWRTSPPYAIRSWLLIFQWQIKYLAATFRLSADELMSFPSLIAELEVAVKSGTPEKRVDTLRRVTNLFLEGSDRFNEQQISVFDDVLVHLIQRIESKALVQLSKSLAPVDNAPLEVIRTLSRHDEITIAGPVLSQSNRISETDLVDIAKRKGQGHLLAISGRNSLSEAVTDVLVDRGSAEVHHALARNSGRNSQKLVLPPLCRNLRVTKSLRKSLGCGSTFHWDCFVNY